MFKNPQSNIRGGNQIIFPDFLTSVENGEVLKLRYRETTSEVFTQMEIHFQLMPQTILI